MLSRGNILRTSADFDNAILFQLKVEVWQNGQIIDYGAIIESNTDDAVKINDGRYLKATCEFKVR